jgi:glycosyltransferase involved in cell wall biosynthesis
MSDNKPGITSKRHCMVVHAYYPIGEPRVEREAHALLASGYEVDVLCLRNDNEPVFEVIDGVGIYRLPMKRHKGRGLAVHLAEYLGFFGLVFFKLLQLYPRRHYGVIQVHNLPDFLVFSALVPKLSGARIILDLHDLMPEFFAGSYNRRMDSLPVKMLIWQEQMSCRFANHVITVTDGWRETLIARGVSGKKVGVVMNVPDNNVFNPAVMEQGSRSDGHFNLIYHGTLTYRYGIDLLLRSIACVRDKIPDIHLVVIGLGEYYEELVALSKELGLEDLVTFSGRILPISELPALIAQADIGIVPTRRNVFTDDLLPTKLLEYVALRVPVIAARTPAISTYFDDNMVQYFTPEDVNSLADSIFYLYQNPERRLALSEKSNKFNNDFSWPKIAQNYVEVVNHLNRFTTQSSIRAVLPPG